MTTASWHSRAISPKSCTAVAALASSVLFVVIGTVSPALADDHFNLEGGLPVTVEDAYPIVDGGKEFQSVFTYERSRDSSARDLFSSESRVAIGVAPGLQLTPRISYSLGDAEERNSGTSGVDLLYQLNEETKFIPVMALSGSLDVPYGYQHGNPETGLKLIAVKKAGEGEEPPDFHLNLEWVHNYDPLEDERADRYSAAVGYSHPITEGFSLVADVVHEQLVQQNQASNLVEFGTRFRLSEALMGAAGIGVGFGANSPGVRITVGIQRSLDDLFGKATE
jgi:hypothetical protein